MTDNLIEFFDAPARIAADGAEYELHPLTMADRIEAEGRIRDARLNQLLKQAPGVKWLPDGVISDAMARLVCQPIQSEEILATYEAQLFLICLSLRHGDSSFNGEQGMTRLRTFPAIKIKTLQSVLWAITGLTKPTSEEATDEDRPTNESPTNSEPSSTGAS